MEKRPFNFPHSLRDARQRGGSRRLFRLENLIESQRDHTVQEHSDPCDTEGLDMHIVYSGAQASHPPGTAGCQSGDAESELLSITIPPTLIRNSSDRMIAGVARAMRPPYCCISCAQIPIPNKVNIEMAKMCSGSSISRTATKRGHER